MEELSYIEDDGSAFGSGNRVKDIFWDLYIGGSLLFVLLLASPFLLALWLISKISR